MVIAHAAMNARIAPLWIAREQGFFAKYGLDVDTLLVRGSAALVGAMTSGDVDVGFTGGTAVASAAASGSDLRIFCSFGNRAMWDVIARPEIQSAQDLRGKKFGVQSIGGQAWMGAILGLEHLGLNIERDKIAILAVGDQSVLSQALVSGTIDATVLDGARSQTLANKGFPILAELKRANIPFLGLAVVARNLYLRTNAQVVEDVLKALIEGSAVALSPAHKVATLKIVQKYLRINEREAQEGYKDILSSFERKPYADPRGLQNIIRFTKVSNPLLEKVKVEELIDEQILRRLDKTGFIDATYAKYGVK